MNELLYTGIQIVGCGIICLAAGIGIGFFGRGILEALSMPDCDEEDGE